MLALWDPDLCTNVGSSRENLQAWVALGHVEVAGRALCGWVHPRAEQDQGGVFRPFAGLSCVRGFHLSRA